MKGVFDGELEKPAEVLSWLDDLLTGADIEQVTVGMKIHLNGMDGIGYGMVSRRGEVH